MLRKTMSPEPRRSASPPRSRSPVNQLQSPTPGTDSLKENLGAHQPPTFPWKTRPLTAGPKSRVAPSRSPTYRRPASSMLQRPSARPFSPSARQKTEISDGDYFGDNIISPWESDLPQTTLRTSFFEKETLPEPHQNRPSTAHRSSPIDKASSEDVLRTSSAAQRPYSAAVGHERHGRRGSWDYDLKNSEHEIRPRTATAVSIEGARINSKMDVVHRIRTENAWLREEMLRLKREVAYESQLNHYRSNSLLHEKEALDARLEAQLSASQETLRQAQESMRQEQKKTEDALSMVKRREDLVHRIKGEAANKKLIRERLVRRLLRQELLGAKGIGIHEDYVLFHGGIGYYFREWRLLAEKAGKKSGEGEGKGPGVADGGREERGKRFRVLMIGKDKSRLREN